MKKHYGFAILVALIFFTSIANSQTPGIREFGVGLANFNSFSLQYRWGSETRLYRLSGSIGGNTIANNEDRDDVTDDSNGHNSSHITTTSTPKNANFGLSFSVLRLRSINENFGFMYGGSYGVDYQYYDTQSNTITISPATFERSVFKNSSRTLQPYIGLSLGAFYKINPSFFVYAEVIPRLSYLYTSGERSTKSATANSYTTYNNDGFAISNISNSNASLTIVYRWTK